MKKTTLLLAVTTLVCNRNIASRDRLWAALCLAALLTTSPPPAQAAVTEAWVHRYNNVVSNAVDQAVKVVRDAAGDIIVTGTSDRDILTIKYSGADGTMLWQHRYSSPTNGSDAPHALAVDASGNVIVAGSSGGSPGWGGPTYRGAYYTAKYAAADGALLWEQFYNDGSRRGGEAVAMAVDGSGNVVVTGHSNNGTNSDYYTVKYATANGALLWQKRYNGPANGDDQARAVAVDSSGNVVVTGYSSNGTNLDYYTAKYAAADGGLLWEQRFDGPAKGEDVARALGVDGTGNVIVTGASSNGTNSDYYTAKYTAAGGTLLWERRYDGLGNGEDAASAVAVDGNGNVIVAGFSYNTNSDADFYTAKYAAADGTLLWERRYDDPANGDDRALALAVDASGNVVVTGFSNNANSDADFYTAKYAAADGALLWEQRYDGPANSLDYANAVAVDGGGNVVVTGSSSNPDSDYYTAKYAAADGALLWEQRYDGLANFDNLPEAVAVDHSGNVVVTGSSRGADYSYDYYTAKYAAANGALLWEKRYNGTGNDTDSAKAVAVDGSGNVVVTGYSYGSGSGADFYTAKYAAADGAPLWEKRYNGPANNKDEAHAIAVDGNGNVVVTGSSVGNGSGLDYYTAKYAAADGAPLWEKRYNGPANNQDEAHAIAVDGSGNVVVTGSSYNATNADYYTAKYAAANGALLWEKRYNGPANNEDFAVAVAVDGSGNVMVTGYSRDSDGYSDYYTAKYLAADGTLLWEKRYNGPTNSDNFASAVAVDGSGNAVVTGYSGGDNYTAKYAAGDGALLWEKRVPYGGASAVAVDSRDNVVVTGNSYNATTADYYTAKYAAADGALLWEKRYNGPANGNDYASSLALGPNGMVAVTGSSSHDYATVVYWEHLPQVSIERVPTGVRLRFAGVPGRSYTIERAPAVTGPWTTLATSTAPLDGLIEYVDTNPPGATAFYRTSAP